MSQFKTIALTLAFVASMLLIVMHKISSAAVYTCELINTFQNNVVFEIAVVIIVAFIIYAIYCLSLFAMPIVVSFFICLIAMGWLMMPVNSLDDISNFKFSDDTKKEKPIKTAKW